MSLLQAHEHVLNAKYEVAIGNPLGVPPKCRGCQKQFTDRKSFRIQSPAIFYPHQSSPQKGRAYFCLNIECIEKAIYRDQVEEKYAMS